MVRMASIAATLLATAAQAQTVPAPSQSDEIVVTAAGLGETPGDPAFGAVTIDATRLQNEATGRLEDVLRDVAGFQQFRRTDSRAANPTSQGATLRALGGNAASRALVLLDGVPVADPFTGFIPYSALDPAGLARVRVTRGGGIGPFGVGAVAGTIELDSAGPDTLPPLRAEAYYGSRDSTQLQGALAQRLGGGYATVTGGWDRGDGYRLIPADQRGPADVPARYNNWNVGVRGVAPITPDIELQASGLAFGDHRLRGLAGTASRTTGIDESVRLLGRGSLPFEVLAYLQTRGFAAGFASANADRTATTKTLDQYETPSTGAGGKIELRPSLGGGNTLRLGADARYADGATHELFRYVAGAPTAIRRAGGEELTYGAFLEDSWTLGILTLTGGGRVDRWEISDGRLDETAFVTGGASQHVRYPDRAGTRPTARAGAILDLPSGVQLRGAAYLGFRVPTLNELYRPYRLGTDATAANAGLKVERLRGVDAGITWRPTPGLKLDLTGFDDRLGDAVANVTLGEGPGSFPQVGFVAAGGAYMQRLNVDAIAVHGLEATATATRGPWRLTASWAYTDARVHASGVAAALDRKRPAETPTNQGSATLAWAPSRGPYASATFRYAGRQWDDDLETRRLPSALTVDAVGELPVGHGLRLIARAENLGNAKVVSGISGTGIEDLGTPRTLWIGLRAQLR